MKHIVHYINQAGKDSGVYNNQCAIFYATRGSGAFDLRSIESRLVMPDEQISIHTGLHIKVPDGYIGMINTRSGNGIKRRIKLGNGIGYIDADYSGEVIVSLHNDGAEPFAVESGQRIAQMALVPVLDGSSVHPFPTSEADFYGQFKKFEGEGARTGGIGSTGND